MNFTFAPQQYPQRETQKNYVFVDEHNRHKRLKVMRACEGCRKRKIKCDAVTTNSWPCSACIRLKLPCVKPNGFDGAVDANAYEGSMGPSDQYQHAQMQQAMAHPGSSSGPQMYAAYPEHPASGYQGIPYDTSQAQAQGMHYTNMHPHHGALDQQYAAQNVFPTPPLQHIKAEQSPEGYSPESYAQQDLSELLGSLKVDEKGTAPYLRNKASFRREEEPAVEDDDDYQAMLPPVTSGPGSKVRIPPELMPDELEALNYIDAFFENVHPYVPVLNKSMFMHQWHTSRESISPLILEAIFALGGRLRDDPSEGAQWLALATRHADAFMDNPRLSTLQGLLLLLKAREASPKRGYYYRSWMTVVQCVQMGIDLGLDEHHDDHESGRGCEYNLLECRLRTRIWQTVFVCEVMVGAPQGRHDLAVPQDSVEFDVPQPMPGGDKEDELVSRNFVYFARVVRNVRRMSSVYTRVKKKKDWGIDPEMVQLNQGFASFLPELPADMAVTYPPDGSPPWLPSSFIGNLHSYFHLSVILYHRPQLSFLDPTTNATQWKHHMTKCYDSAKALCKLQEAIVNSSGLEGLMCMQRGYSFTVYCGLSCIVLHLVCIVSPDPDFNSDAAEYFSRHMRIMEKVMEVWTTPELRQQVEAVREAFSADTRKPFQLKPTFPYGSPHPSNHSSPPQAPQGYRPAVDRVGPKDPLLDAAQSAPNVSFPGYPITPPVSSGAADSKSDSPIGQPNMVMISQGGQVPALHQNMPLPEQPAWNPQRIFEQWNTSFGTLDTATAAARNGPLNFSSPPGPHEGSNMQEYHGANDSLQQGGPSQLSPQQYSAPPAPIISPAQWQASVASVYEGGLKRAWDYDGSSQMMQRRH